MVSAIPTQYPVTLTDGDREYPVFNATEYVNAVFKLGHSPAGDQAPTDSNASNPQ